MYTYQQRLEYAKHLQRLQQLVVIKDNIHLTYQYKNRNKAYANIDSVQDRINKAIIEDAVNGNVEPIKNLGKQGQKLINDTLINERKRLHPDKKHKAINHATKSNSQYYTGIFNYRRNKLGESLKDKIDKEMKKPSVIDLSDTEKIQHLTDKYGDHGKQRLKNIIKDAMHTNESNIGFIKAIEDGYNYKIWKNGRVAKGRTRAWHKEKYIQAVPIDETFDIYGSYPAHMMYPGDLNGGAENVANCRCVLYYTNNIPNNFRKNTQFNVSPTFQQIWEKGRNPSSKLKTTIKKPIQKAKKIISNNTKQIKSKFKKFTNTSQIKKIKTISKTFDQFQKPKKKSLLKRKIKSPFKKLFNNNSNSYSSSQEIILNSKQFNDVKITQKHDFMTIEDAKKLYDSLKPVLKFNIDEIQICPTGLNENGKPIQGRVKSGSRVLELLFDPDCSIDDYKSVVYHEAAHILDHAIFGEPYGLSSSKMWGDAFILDNQHNIFIHPETGEQYIRNVFPTKYAKDKANEHLRNGELKRFFAEDFAESVRLYLNKDIRFMNRYPNRYNLLKKIIGEP